MNEEQQARPRVGDWLCTVSGVEFYPLDPRPEEILIQDIAHALSHMCRFAGHVRAFYSVGDHSVLVARRVMEHWGNRPGREHAGLAGLLHDGSEAYMVDVPRPIKRLAFMGQYRTHETVLQHHINKKFGVEMSPELEELVHLADNEVLATEKRDLMPHTSWEGKRLRPWALPPALDYTIVPLSPLEGRERFFALFNELQEPT